MDVKKLSRQELEQLALSLLNTYNSRNLEFDEVNSNKIFSHFISEWLEIRRPKLAPTTYRGYCNIINNHLIPYFGDTDLISIDYWAIENYYNFKINNISENTIKKHYTLLKIFFKKAKNLKYIDVNPMDLVEPISLSRSTTSYYDENDLMILLKKLRHTRYYPVVLLCSLGLRRSEALGVRWDNINFDTKELEITGKICPETEEYSLKLKTATSYRTIIIPDNLIFEFKALKFFSECDFVCENTYKTHLSNAAASKGLSYYIKKHNLKKITLKGLRHTCATLLSRKGYNLNYVKDWLGHSTIKLTADTYSHVDMNDKQAIANSLNNFFIF